MWLHLLLFTIATSTASLLPIGGTALAPRVWLTPDVLTLDEAALMRSAVLRAPAYPCPLQEKAWPTKRCAKVAMGTLLGERLAASWPGLNLTSLSSVAASIDFPSDDIADVSMRHHVHTDVFPERPAGSRGPDATGVLYLSEAPPGHPATLSGPTIFPRPGVRVVPRVGSLLAWANVLDGGEPDPEAAHGVGPYAGSTELPPRVALHLPISFEAESGVTAHGEHVGCSGPPLAVMRAAERILRPHRIESSWHRVADRLHRHVRDTLLRKMRLIGSLAVHLSEWQARAAERVYAPGGLGYGEAALEFAELTEEQGAASAQAGAPPSTSTDPSPTSTGAVPSAEMELAGSDCTAAVAAAMAGAALSAAAAASELKRRRKAAMVAALQRAEKDFVGGLSISAEEQRRAQWRARHQMSIGGLVGRLLKPHGPQQDPRGSTQSAEERERELTKKADCFRYTRNMTRLEAVFSADPETSRWSGILCHRLITFATPRSLQ